MSSVTFNDWWNVKREHDQRKNGCTTENVEKICTSCLLLSACEGGEEEEGRAASDDFCRKTEIGNKVR